jgi:hypothetical protein
MARFALLDQDGGFSPGAIYTRLRARMLGAPLVKPQRIHFHAVNATSPFDIKLILQPMLQTV